ncbi:hypothetical protein [uncultured Shewanella sp.]|uniref:hypothetical protein n=1 Tax=uncultured Shewanella sp. TaxID=173975 RepID=UPI002637A410|nr:hypothetical protein [uncultured Shewanella sp.]
MKINIKFYLILSISLCLGFLGEITINFLNNFNDYGFINRLSVLIIYMLIVTILIAAIKGHDIKVRVLSLFSNDDNSKGSIFWLKIGFIFFCATFVGQSIGYFIFLALVFSVYENYRVLTKE